LVGSVIKGKHGAGLFGKRGPGCPKGSHLGVYSCNTSLVEVDKRSREYRLMRQVRKDLTAHIGGSPNPAQRMLIERAVVLSLRVAMLDQKIVSGEILTQLDNNQYLAWSNALVRTIARLGIDPAAGPQPTLEDTLAGIVARRRPDPDDDDDEDDAA
jgi:hypothetical protein